MDKIVITDNYSTSSHMIARRTDKEIEINTYDHDIEHYTYLVITLAEAKRLRDFLIKALKVAAIAIIGVVILVATPLPEMVKILIGSFILGAVVPPAEDRDVDFY